MSVNRVILLGRLGKDPELRYTQGGMAVCSLNMATSEQWKDKNTGEKQERTEWHRVIVWGKQGENCHQYLKKGSQVYVEGRLQTRSWEDQQTGTKKYATEILAQTTQFIGSRDSQNAPSMPQDDFSSVDMGAPMGSGESPTRANTPQQGQYSSPVNDTSFTADDIPF